MSAAQPVVPVSLRDTVTGQVSEFWPVDAAEILGQSNTQYERVTDDAPEISVPAAEPDAPKPRTGDDTPLDPAA